MSKATRVDLTPEHLRPVRTRQKAASIARAKDVLASLAQEERAGISIAELARRSGLAARTLRRPHVRPVLEAALGRPVCTKAAPGADVGRLLRRIESLRVRLDKEKRLRVKDRGELAAQAATISELRRLVDLLSQEAREDMAGR